MKAQILTVLRIFTKGRRAILATTLSVLAGTVLFSAANQDQELSSASSIQPPTAPQIGGTKNLLQIALLEWYRANLTTTFAVGPRPYGVAFDGENVWVSNWGDNSVTKLRANDGKVLGTFSVAVNPLGLAFDGANIWIAENWVDNGVTAM